jgi:hypothetical protein
LYFKKLCSQLTTQLKCGSATACRPRLLPLHGNSVLLHWDSSTRGCLPALVTAGSCPRRFS